MADAPDQGADSAVQPTPVPDKEPVVYPTIGTERIIERSDKGVGRPFRETARGDRSG
jgi:hypothetical protein